MNLTKRIAQGLGALGLLATIASPVRANHAQVSAVAVNPNKTNEVWVCNRDNNSVSVMVMPGGAILAEIPVGIKPRSLAFSDDGQKVFVANKRGNVPHDVHFVTPFTGNEERGTVSVIDVPSRTVVDTLFDEDVGVEPYGLAVAPNGEYFAVTAFRSGWITLFRTDTHAQLTRYDFQADLNFITGGQTIGDLDEDQDGLSDLQDPRGFVITMDSQRIFVTHNKSPWISVLDVTLDGSGLPTGISLTEKINFNQYPFHPIFNPTPVQTVKSQGVPRFMEDISLSPDGTRALVPGLLHNVNHDVNHDFGGQIAGDFANRVYPMLTMIDAGNLSFDPGNDASNVLHHELDDEPFPAAFIPVGLPRNVAGGKFILGGSGAAAPGGMSTFSFQPGLLGPGETAQLLIGRPIKVPMGPAGIQYSTGRLVLPFVGSSVNFTWPVGIKDGTVVGAQAVIRNSANQIIHFSSGLKVVVRNPGLGFETNKMGFRAGHPSRVLWSPDGTKAIMLNRGSEDLFLYEVNGSDMTLKTVFPERHFFQERTPFDTTTPIGDLPIGMAMVPDTDTPNNDAILYVMNEVTRTLSMLRIDWDTGTMFEEKLNQAPTRNQPDIFSQSVLIGNELFEDASRAQTAGNFNNSCASCHFEGGEDANVWQRPAGPRSTMPVYGGTLLTGSILWKGVRLNMGETGPMFGGENGGHGTFTNAEQQGLIDYHETIPVPLNPHFDLATSNLTAQAALGQDLFFGTDLTMMNPNGRQAGCAVCHPKEDNTMTEARGFTADHLPSFLTGDPDGLQTFDPNCINLQQNILAQAIRNVNSGVNTDTNPMDGIPDPDRNFDGFVDVETYVPMNADADDDFTRDDPNGYLCPDPNMPSQQKVFSRPADIFSIPTKLGVFATPPYFHDHVLYSLRVLLDPEAQMIDPIYGTPGRNAGDPPYPGAQKFFNEFHDIRGHEDFVPSVSKVQIDLQSTDVDADIEAILSFISSL